MAYNKVPIGTSNPGLTMILVDQSYSMRDAYGAGQKKDVAAMAVNRVIYEIVLACQSGEKIKDRIYMAVIGYGDNIDVLIEGKISEIAENPIDTKEIMKKEPDGAGGLVEVKTIMPIWIKPKAENGTPMGHAFDVAHRVADNWIQKNSDNFPPIVINISDGEPNDPDHTRDAALRLMDIQTNDGKLLMLNAHISDLNAGEVLLPNSDVGLHDEYAKFLFEISSELPQTLIDAAINVGFSPPENARGFLFNAGAENLIKLLHFGSLGTLR